MDGGMSRAAAMEAISGRLILGHCLIVHTEKKGGGGGMCQV